MRASQAATKVLSRALHLNLDGAWRDEPLKLPTIDAGEWGPQLRFSAPPRVVEKFYREFAPQIAPFILYGSGDFHYLSGLWLRRLNEPAVLISFDNHPDWDVRPPKWGCGGWINRALELVHVQHIAIWGCGNFESWWPHNIFANRSAERAGRLEVHPWVDDRPMKDRQRPGAILRENWRDLFEDFVARVRGANVYVTIDLDCLRIEDAVTNWENGRLTVADLQWALGKLRESVRIVAGDICGAYSEPKYARWKQKFASEWDHPKLDLPSADEFRGTNIATLEKLWPALAD
jgi:arginase family enzyme